MGFDFQASGFHGQFRGSIHRLVECIGQLPQNGGAQFQKRGRIDGYVY